MTLRYNLFDSGKFQEYFSISRCPIQDFELCIYRQVQHVLYMLNACKKNVMEVPSYKISKLKDMYNKIYTKFSDRYFLDSDEVFILIIFILIYHNQKIMVSTHVSSLSWECSVLMMGTWPQCPPAECEYERGWQTGDWGTRLHSLHSSQHNLVSQLLRIKQLFNNSDSTSSWHRWDKKNIIQ